MKSLSMDSMASAFNLPSVIEFHRNVLILFNVEKHRSASAVVIGIVRRTFNNFKVSVKVACRLLFTMKSYNPDTVELVDEQNSSVK